MRKFGIAQVATEAGFHVILNEVGEAMLRKGMSSMRRSLRILKDKMADGEVEASFNRVRFQTNGQRK